MLSFFTHVFIKPKKQVSNQHQKWFPQAKEPVFAPINTFFIRVYWFRAPVHRWFSFWNFLQKLSCGVRLQNPFRTLPFGFKSAPVLLFTPEPACVWFTDIISCLRGDDPRNSPLISLFPPRMTESEIHVAIPLIQADRNPLSLYFSSLAIIRSGNRSGLHQTQ